MHDQITKTSLVRCTTATSPFYSTSIPNTHRHTLTDDEKASYIEAELCLMDKEATLGLNGTKNRFEELQAAHQIQADIVHGVVCFHFSFSTNL